MTDEARIAQLTENMRFERKIAVTPREKAAYAAAQAACEDAMRSLRKLNLRLWHACEGNYRSLPMDEARALLEEAKEKIDAALAQCPRGMDEA
jgi:hypothetical protein